MTKMAEQAIFACWALWSSMFSICSKLVFSFDWEEKDYSWEKLAASEYLKTCFRFANFQKRLAYYHRNVHHTTLLVIYSQRQIIFQISLSNL